MPISRILLIFLVLPQAISHKKIKMEDEQPGSAIDDVEVTDEGILQEFGETIFGIPAPSDSEDELGQKTPTTRADPETADAKRNLKGLYTC